MEQVTTETEVDYTHFRKTGWFYDWCWIGLRYNSSNINKTWEWVNGNPTTYSHWAQPPTGVGCGVFSYYYGWYIYDCSSLFMTVCQAPFPVTGLTADSVENNGVSLSWSSPSQLDEVPHYFIITYSNSNSDDEGAASTADNSTVFSNLRPGREYVFKVCTKENNTFLQSQPTSASVYIIPSPPGEINIGSVGTVSVSLSWGNPVDMEGVQYNFIVSCYGSFWGDQHSIIMTSNSTVITNLGQGCNYTLNITTAQPNGHKSLSASTFFYTNPVPPGLIKIVSVGNDSVSLSWGRPSATMQFSYSYNITYASSFWDQQDSSIATSESTVISNLRPGSEYVFNVTTVQVNGAQSTPTSISLYTSPSPPEGIRVDFVETNSVSLSWGKPVYMDEINHSFAITYSCSFWLYKNSTTVTSNSVVLSYLRPGSEYIFNVTTVQYSGAQSTSASISQYTNPTPPGEISVDFVGNDSVSLSWGIPDSMGKVPYSFNITYSSSFWNLQNSTPASSYSTVISNLRPGSEYTFNVTTVQRNGGRSTPVSTTLYTVPPPPGKIRIDSVESNSVSLSWGSPVGMDGLQYSFSITYSSSFWGHNGSTTAPSNSTVISNLRLGSEYVFSVTTVNKGGQSTPSITSVYTKLAPPGEIRVDSVGNDSVSLSWGSPVGMDGLQYSFNITYSSSFWGHNGSTNAPSNSTVISNLRPGSEYVFNITTVQASGGWSTPASISLYTKPNEKRLYLKFVCSSTERSVCEKEKQKVQQETEARLAKQLKGLYWKLNWKEKEVKECSDEPEGDV
ncbi:receptor-type tyrosine-protein phosphatase eta-like isoform X2 [Polyodon spathula]|uniref:receptor-type tyrosine-protein phosphatase eta-like isoform X2 n=1 Tax=Polyodon spathula TaxID=7913 RepID=UPI001B7EF7D0|nr:receptor-type tyrosine-protein phosphatase eta-like isoform X2 [Polyodon spathula]